MSAKTCYLVFIFCVFASFLCSVHGIKNEYKMKINIIINIFIIPFLFSFLLSGLTDLAPRSVAPDYRLQYEVYYNTLENQVPDKACAEHYARTFLSTFIASQSDEGLQGRLHWRCNNQSSGDARVRVAIHTVAVVRIYDQQVSNHESERGNMLTTMERTSSSSTFLNTVCSCM